MENLPLNVDVTVPLGFYVESSRLRLAAGHKGDLFGFYNPLAGKKGWGADEGWEGPGADMMPQL